MDKDEALKKIIELGFAASMEDGTVMITVKSEAERNRARKAVNELGLRGSWGTRGEETDGAVGRYEKSDKQA